MPEPFKNNFNPEMIAQMAHHFSQVWPEFDVTGFIAQSTDKLDLLELKQRANQIKCALETHLPRSFKKTAPIIINSLHPEMEDDIEGDGMDGRGIRGWAILPLTQYVGEFGLDDFDLGMDVQKELTKRFTSEFGIRDFIAHDMDRALKTMTAWVDDPNVHVRRLVSEGTRPRLPWASTLPDFIENPEPVIPLLTILRDDVDEYVRRSVANHLNDIAKDHPDRVAGIAKEWMVKATPKREKLVRHALRTLIKNGHPGALSALGYGKPVLTLSAFDIQAPRVEFGNALNFSMCLMSDSRSDQDLIVDYIIHHKKANGKTSPKVFKWKNIVLKAGKDHKATRNHRIKAISTRKYYPGVHHLEIVVNGVCLGRLDFELMM